MNLKNHFPLITVITEHFSLFKTHIVDSSQGPQIKQFPDQTLCSMLWKLEGLDPSKQSLSIRHSCLVKNSFRSPAPNAFFFPLNSFFLLCAGSARCSLLPSFGVSGSNSKIVQLLGQRKNKGLFKALCQSDTCHFYLHYVC